SLEGRIGVADADFLEPTARPDPVGQHAYEQRLAIGAAGDKGLESIVFAHVVAIVVQVLPIFLQAGPAHGVDDRQRTVVARRNRIADGNIVKVNWWVHKTPNKLF